jgi:hypothetical protein
LSNLEPAGSGNGRINDGFNRNWNLGAGVAANRTALPANAGTWPNAIRLSLELPTTIAAGDSFSVDLYHQAGANATGGISAGILLDPDANPYDGNEIEVQSLMLPRTGTGAVSFNTLSATADAAMVLPGAYWVCARVSDGGRTRYLYASQPLIVTPSLQPPSIDGSTLAFSAGAMHFNVLALPGQQVVVMVSSDLANWAQLQTHTFMESVWQVTDATAGNYGKRFYRVALAP